MGKAADAKTAVELDAKDRKILSELDMDARQPLSALAKKVGLSREVVNYRIRQLERSRVILGYYTVLDTAKLGLIYCRMFFKYRKMPSEKQDELFSFCANHRNISWIIQGDGRWDIVLVVLVHSLNEIENVYNELNNRFGQYFQNPHVSIALRVHEFKHNYLYAKPDYAREFVVGAGEKSASLDDTDYVIIDLLSEDARISLVDMAKELELTPKMAGYRIKRLLAEKAILGFRAKINISLLGYSFYVFISTMRTLNASDEAKLNDIVATNKNVLEILKTLGDYDVLTYVAVESPLTLHKTIKDFKHRFAHTIKNYLTLVTYKEHVYKPVPEAVVKGAD